jgi:transcriptional regulator with XRE-family HTH domain
MDRLNHLLIARQLLRTLRGRRSQLQFSRRLGYRSNVVYAWEAGRKAPTASTFFALLSRVGLDPLAAVGDFYTSIPAEWTAELLHTTAGVGQFLRLIREETSISALAELTGTSRHALGRWLRGDAEPRLPDLLVFIDAATGRLPDFVATLVDPSGLPTLRTAWARLQRARHILIDEPWVQTVLMATELADYMALPSHSDPWIANRLGVDHVTAAQGIQRLADAGLITWTGSHWTAGAPLVIDTRRAQSGQRALKRYWLEEVQQRFEDEQDGLFSHNVFAVAAEDLPRLRELHIDYFHRVRDLVVQSAGSERIVLLQTNLVALDEGEREIGR